MKVGVVGLGFMGRTHLDAYSQLPEVEIAAVCSDSDPASKRDAATALSSSQPAPSRFDVSQTRRFTDWREFLNQDLDAVDICLPTDLHAAVAVAALSAGKHVLCEKPMALTLTECGRMLSAAAAVDRILMIGHVLRFWPEYRYLRDFVKSGEFGCVRSATFVRRCALPDWSNWLGDTARSGGAILDLLLHDIDQALSLFGMPDRVAAKSFGPHDTCMATLIYAAGPEVRIQGGWLQTGMPLSMSFDVRAERGALEWTRAGLMLTDLAGRRAAVSLAAGDAYQTEIAYFVQCCRNSLPPVECPPEESARAVQLALLIKESRDAGGEAIKCSV